MSSAKSQYSRMQALKLFMNVKLKRRSEKIKSSFKVFSSFCFFSFSFLSSLLPRLHTTSLHPTDWLTISWTQFASTTNSGNNSGSTRKSKLFSLMLSFCRSFALTFFFWFVGKIKFSEISLLYFFSIFPLPRSCCEAFKKWKEKFLYWKENKIYLVWWKWKKI